MAMVELARNFIKNRILEALIKKGYVICGEDQYKAAYQLLGHKGYSGSRIDWVLDIYQNVAGGIEKEGGEKVTSFWMEDKEGVARFVISLSWKKDDTMKALRRQGYKPREKEGKRIVKSY